jgi:putative spermidine/putrescine transport system substrate-binding protein
MSSVTIHRPTVWIIAATMLAMLCLSAEAAPKVVVAVYAGQDAQLFRRLVAEPFTKASGITTEVFEAQIPAAAIAAADGHPEFNVAIVSGYSAAQLASKGLLVELTKEQIPAISIVPEPFWPKTPDGKLTGMPVQFSMYAIAFNTDLAKASDFQSWNALLDPRWKGQVSMTRPSISAAYDLTLFAKLNGGDERNFEPAVPSLEKFARNALSVYTSMASLMSQLGRGEVTAAPFYTDEIIHLKRSGVKNIDFVLPKEGGLMLPYILVIPKGAQDVDSASKLLNAIVEPSYQVNFAVESGLLPVNPATELSPALQAELGGTVEQLMARNFSPDWYYIGTHLDERTRFMEELIQKAK